MKILASKSNLYNTVNFLNQVYKQDYIDGAVLNISMTRDEKVIIFNPISSTDSTLLATIQSQTYAQLQAEELMTLEEALTFLAGVSKKLVLNILPLSQSILFNLNIEERTMKNKIYIEKVSTILNKFPQMDIYVASNSNKLIFHMKEMLPQRKIGFVYYTENIGYEDLDFYMFSSVLYDEALFREQLNRNKEIMVYIFGMDDLSTLYNGFCEKCVTEKEKKAFHSIYYITDHPDIVYKLFQ